jgi:hypothetical protein
MACAYVPRATDEMARDMAGRLSPLDLREVKAGGGRPLESLLAGVAHSDECWAYTLDDRPFAIVGISAPGRIWMLTARDIKKPEASWFFARRAKADLAERMARWGALGNFVYDKNEPHKRLLEWLGFEFGDTVEVNGHPFRQFWSAANV